VLQDGIVKLQSRVSSPNGEKAIEAGGEAPAADAVALGQQLAADLLSNGAGEIIAGLGDS
jgi:hydroxymethylbilane synthase